MTWIGEIRDGFKAVLDAWKWWQGRNERSVADRFFLLLESHGVHRNQIPRFIGHGLMLADVQNSATLNPKLTEALLNDVCDKFAVRREWLDGAEPEIYKRHDFYKKPENFLTFL